MLIVAWLKRPQEDHQLSDTKSFFMMTMQNNVCDWRPSNNNIFKKQANKQNTYTKTKCKQRAVRVCLTSEPRVPKMRTCAQLFSPVLSVGFTRQDLSQRPVLGGLHTVWHLDYTGGSDCSQSLTFFLSCFLSFYLTLSIFVCICNLGSHSSPSLTFSILLQQGPQVAATREQMMNSSKTEPADSLRQYFPLVPFILSSVLPSFLCFF